MAMALDGLAKLTEELGELQQVVGKLLAYPAGEHPDGKGPLHERLVDEIADVHAALVFAQEKLELPVSKIRERAEKKLHLFHFWDRSTTTPSDKIEATRAAFERAWLSRNRNHGLERNQYGYYQDIDTYHAWGAWKDAIRFTYENSQS